MQNLPFGTEGALADRACMFVSGRGPGGGGGARPASLLSHRDSGADLGRAHRLGPDHSPVPRWGDAGVRLRGHYDWHLECARRCVEVWEERSRSALLPFAGRTCASSHDAELPIQGPRYESEREGDGGRA